MRRDSGARFHLQDDVRMGVHMGAIGTAIAQSSVATARPQRPGHGINLPE
jgi:hypothetical protein